jgi:BirA family biotin operon repressor/biotin-[acetyl-CoA-carboxylase] ligase
LNHKHFKEISSTQDYLIEYQSELAENSLISCDTQVDGHGQYDRSWDSYQGSVCLSFTLSANEVITLSSLEIGCLITKYISTEYNVNLGLKWPNDILTSSGTKVGGILINNSSRSSHLVVGVGLNYFPFTAVDQYKTPGGSIFQEESSLNKKSEAQKIYRFILDNRMTAQSVVKFWNEKCIHLNKEVTLIDSDKSIEGEFVGIGKNGEALIHQSGTTASYFSGSIIL